MPSAGRPAARRRARHRCGRPCRRADDSRPGPRSGHINSSGLAPTNPPTENTMHDGYRAISRSSTSGMTNGRLAVMSIRRASTTLSRSPSPRIAHRFGDHFLPVAVGHRRHEGELVGGPSGPECSAALRPTCRGGCRVVEPAVLDDRDASPPSPAAPRSGPAPRGARARSGRRAGPPWRPGHSPAGPPRPRR